MHFFSLISCSCFIAFLHTAPLHAAGKQPTVLENMIPLLFIFFVMYFLVIRPQAQKNREQDDFLRNAKPGDEIITTGGIVGKVRSVTEQSFTIETGSAVVKVAKKNVQPLPATTNPKKEIKTTHVRRKKS